MAMFDLFRRMVKTAATNERRAEERVRTTLGARVLVVDDSATIRAVLGKMLAQDGYETLKAADGESGVETAQSQLPDLIFLDIVLPGMSGFAVLRALRRDPRTRKTPIIMMSGNQQATEQFYVQRFGADGFLKKPFGRGEVFHAILQLVEASRLATRAERPSQPTIPDGVTAEEWDAIPDVAMPDADHVAAAQTPQADATPDTPASTPASGAPKAALPSWLHSGFGAAHPEMATGSMLAARPLMVTMPFENVPPPAVQAHAVSGADAQAAAPVRTHSGE